MGRVNRSAVRKAKATPLRRRPDVTRRRIFEAAAAEFAGKGLAGARVDEIARRAGSNKRMLYQYYGNKEALWLSVLEHAYEAIREEERLLDVGRLDPVEGMRRLVAYNVRYTGAHPEFIALLNSENLHRARYLKKSRKVQSLYSPLLAMIGDVLERGRRQGVFRSGVDPMQLYISIASLGYFYYSNIHTLSTIFGRKLSSAKARKARERHVVDMVLGYLKS
ncbi:MAG TPA: TetR/AcrR family transcriptional regulator [Candidatus Cybelea sp.]|nr:TetR/AcrR family transcriptional regulator [Candidatus Cybelea sp.]